MRMQRWAALGIRQRSTLRCTTKLSVVPNATSGKYLVDECDGDVSCVGNIHVCFGTMSSSIIHRCIGPFGHFGSSVEVLAAHPHKFVFTHPGHSLGARC